MLLIEESNSINTERILELDIPEGGKLGVRKLCLKIEKGYVVG
jgi:hypothetical protein